MIVFELPADMERRSLSERLRVYASQLAPRDGGLRLIALLEEAADELELVGRPFDPWIPSPR